MVAGQAGNRQSYAEAVALHKAGRHRDADAMVAALLEADPNNPDLWNLRGVNYRVVKRYGEAIRCLRRGLALAPGNAALWGNLGNALKDARSCESAVVCHRKAVAIDPTPSALHNLGIALSAAAREAEAVATYDQALARAPGNPDILWDRALSRFRLGDFGAFEDHESRQFRTKWEKRDLPGEPWTGRRYDGKTLLIASEQGLGDTIWVARYFKMAKALGGRLVVECRAGLEGLIASLGVADAIVTKYDPLPPADYHILQCSLPRLFTAGEAEIPSAPYLAAAPADVDKLAAAFGPRDGRLRVGVIWGGSPSFDGRADRDTALPHFLTWLALPHVQLYSLQKGPQADDLAKLPAGAPIVDLGAHTANLTETAGAIAHLDLVVMTDTCVAHLAGAMGRPVWVLLNRVPHWLWQLDRPDTPWYPSMRLFRQESWGHWQGVFDRAAAALLGVKA